MNHVFLFVAFFAVFFVLIDDDGSVAGIAENLNVFFKSIFGKTGHEDLMAVNHALFLFAGIQLAQFSNIGDAATGIGFQTVEFIERTDHHENDGFCAV